MFLASPLLHGPELTLAVALAVGVLGQAVAAHLRLPGILLLLGLGVALGPDGAALIDPAALGSALFSIVGFAVSVILFEGGMNLNIKRIRRLKAPIRRLITLGALVSVVGGALAARFILHLGWRVSVLFGTLVVVTGPTVITPLLRRIRVTEPVETTLEAEGVFGDAVGAVLAVVAFEFALRPFGAAGILESVLGVVLRLAVGVAVGALAGALIVALFKVEKLVPDGLENVLTLSFVFVTYELANLLMSESGIAAAIVAGMMVGNAPTRALRQLAQFKEQLTVLLIGLLFVLLAANVRLERVYALGVPGLAVAAALMFVIRPLGVLLSTRSSGLSWRERAFIAWLGPRGIVAAAIASLFAGRLQDLSSNEANALQAEIFLIIAVTVTSAGLTGSLAARLLGVKRPKLEGFLLLGAHRLGRELGRALARDGSTVVLLDANPSACRLAEEEGLRVFFGNALEERTLLLAQLDARAGALAMTPNEEVNLLFARLVRELSRATQVQIALATVDEGVTKAMVHAAGARVLFGAGCDPSRWSNRMERGRAALQLLRCKDAKKATLGLRDTQRGDENLFTLLLLRRGKKLLVIDDQTSFRADDEVTAVVLTVRGDDVSARLAELGWEREAAA